MTVLHRFTLIAAHFVVRLFGFVSELKAVFSYIWSILLPDFVVSSIGELALPFARLQQELNTFQRRPVHLALVIAENDISYPDIAKVVVWSISVGIRNISVYDHGGEIKKNSDALKASIFSKKSLSMDASDSSIYVINKFSSSENGVSVGSNGYHKEPVFPVHLSLLSSHDGRSNIVFTAQKLAEQFRNNSADIDDINIETFGNALNGNRGLPCPDLIICFGPTYSTLGFLPWHITVTEILKESSHHHITYDTFHRLLRSFSQCEQRLGK